MSEISCCEGFHLFHYILFVLVDINSFRKIGGICPYISSVEGVYLFFFDLAFRLYAKDARRLWSRPEVKGDGARGFRDAFELPG